MHEHRHWLIGLAAAALLAGCASAPGFEAAPRPPKPSTADIARLVSETREPFYWLGPRYGKYRLSEIRRLGARKLRVSYGKFACDGSSGCWAHAGVIDGPGDVAGAGLEGGSVRGGSAPQCWRKLGRAVVFVSGCDPEGEEATVFTGHHAIYLDSPRVADVARNLRPLNARAPWPMPPPPRLSCDQYTHARAIYRKHMPASLRPRKTC
jgi:hypothetical protein